MLISEHKEIGALIPREIRRAGLDATRLCSIILDATLRTPEILDCIPATIIRCVRTSAELGLEIGSPLGEAYAVPFRSKKGPLIATFVAGYKGLIKLAVGSPEIRNIEARLVWRGDEFDYNYGTNPRVHHKPVPSQGPRDPRDVLAAYSVAYFAGAKAADGACQFEVMERPDLDEIRARSKATNGPWKTDAPAMFRKCPVRRLANTLDLSSLGRMKRALEADEDDRHVRPAGLQDIGSDAAARTEEEIQEGELVEDGAP